MKNFYLMLLFCGIFIFSENFIFAQVAVQVPLDPTVIPKYVDPLPHFAGLRVDAKTGGNLTIKAVPHKQVAVSTGTVLANGTVGITPGAGVGNYWVYQISKDGGVNFTKPLWPAFTIETSRGNPLNVTYINDLGGQTYDSVNLVVDQTLHWADPLDDHGSMLAYEGPVPIVPHLHGGEVPSESDGGPDAWFTPDYSITGPAWAEGVDQFYYYPNTQEGATLWFHDHALGATRLNVYAGMAGFYFLRETNEDNLKLPGWSGDDLVQEVAPVGASGTFNPEPYLPEIEIVFQDRMFDTNGQLYFPNLSPNPLDHPFWTPEFIGNVITVNGKTWPYLSVATRKYRFRMLNGSNARFYELKLFDLVSGMAGPVITQIGTDGGFLETPVPVTSMGKKLILAPGERADVIIDFSASAPGQAWTLTNSAKTPYPNGGVVNPNTTGQVMQFIVNGTMVSAADGSPGVDNSLLPTTLRPSPMVKLSDFAGGTMPEIQIDTVRQLTLNEVATPLGPLEALVNNTKWDGNGPEDGLGITETPTEGETELWQIINLTGDAHPIHLHLVQFQLVGRQMFNTNKYGKEYANAYGGTVVDGSGPPNDYHTLNGDGAVGGNPAISGFLQGKIYPPNPNEMGWKDTYIVYPGEVTTFIIRFAPTDIQTTAPASDLVFDFDPSTGPGYVWHCHIIDHEDNEMMRPYKVGASDERGASLAASLKSGIRDLGLSEQSLNPENLTGVTLNQNYPNPFNTNTEIQFQLPETMHIELIVFNQQGQVVKVLLNQDTPSGNHTVKLNGSGLVQGIYYYRLSAGNYVATKKMIVN